MKSVLFGKVGNLRRLCGLIWWKHIIVLEENLATCSMGLLGEHVPIVARHDKKRLALIDGAEQFNFFPVQDCIHIDSLTARRIGPNRSAHSKMRCGDVDLDGVVIRILVYQVLSSLLSLKYYV